MVLLVLDVDYKSGCIENEDWYSGTLKLCVQSTLLMAVFVIWIVYEHNFVIPWYMSKRSLWNIEIYCRVNKIAHTLTTPFVESTLRAGWDRKSDFDLTRRNAVGRYSDLLPPKSVRDWFNCWDDDLFGEAATEKAGGAGDGGWELEEYDDWKPICIGGASLFGNGSGGCWH